MVYPLKLESDTLAQFTQFKAMVELQFSCKIKVVQSDGGGEFLPFTRFVTDLGILHKFTCPHIHHQNGLVERKHRHIVNVGLMLLPQADIPRKLWDHAVITAAFFINRIPITYSQQYLPLFSSFPETTQLQRFKSIWMCMLSILKTIYLQQTCIQITRMCIHRLLNSLEGVQMPQS